MEKENYEDGNGKREIKWEENIKLVKDPMQPLFRSFGFWHMKGFKLAGKVA